MISLSTYYGYCQKKQNHKQRIKILLWILLYNIFNNLYKSNKTKEIILHDYLL